MTRFGRAAEVLGLLMSDGGWMYAPAMMGRLGWSSWRAGSLYAALHLLEADGAVESQWDGGQPRRRQYRVRTG